MTVNESSYCKFILIPLQGPDGNRIPILAQGVKEIVISLLNQPTDSSLKAIVQVLKVRTLHSYLTLVHTEREIKIMSSQRFVFRVTFFAFTFVFAENFKKMELNTMWIKIGSLLK